MNRILLALMVALGLCLASCDKEPGLDQSCLVVEGWIEDGGFPVVILTQSVPAFTKYKPQDVLKDYIVRWAWVAVTDGTDTVVLTGKYAPGYFPPFIYTTSRMRGQSGKSYTLIVKNGHMQATATTTIPARPSNGTFKVEPCEDNDSLYQIIACFKDDPATKNYYQFFTRVGLSTKQYLASYLGSVDDAILGPETRMPVYRGHHMTNDSYTPYYTLHDSVSVKFAQVDEAAYQFWDGYTKLLSLSGNLFLSSHSSLLTNIDGGMGYWCGYGAITADIVIADSVKAMPPAAGKRP